MPRKQRRDPRTRLQRLLEDRSPTLEWRVVVDPARVALGSVDRAIVILARSAPGRPAVRVERQLDDLQVDAAQAAALEVVVADSTAKLQAVDPT